MIEEVYKNYTQRLLKNGFTEDKAKEHIKRFWLQIINLKSYDLVSKKALNPLFTETLKQFNIKKSVEFSDPLKKAYWNEGLKFIYFPQ